MGDTSPEVDAIYRARLMALSGEERILMASSMFEDARRMILSSLPAGLSVAQRRRVLFERLYGSDPEVVWPFAAANDPQRDETIVITTYLPDPADGIR